MRPEASADRIKQRLEAVHQIGKRPGGGATRLALSREEQEAVLLCQDWMQSCGLSTRFDPFGNLFGRRMGRYKDRAPVLTGSHVDTVPDGGRFDGTVGVVTALEAVECMNEMGLETDRPIEVVVMRGEESSRFGLATLGSRVLTGNLPTGFHDLTDADGVTLGSALSGLGLDPARCTSAQLGPDDAAAFLEVHVEQGPVLEREHHRLGIVTGCVETTRYRLEVGGEAQHSGAAGMADRRDALVGAALIIAEAEAIARATGGGSVATIGEIDVAPNAINVVPGKVTLGIDVRSITPTGIDRIIGGLRSSAARIAHERGLSLKWEHLSTTPAVTFAGTPVRALRNAAESLGLDFLTMYSAAGHDAMNLSHVAPTAMLFVPSAGGISHNPLEYSDADDIALATDVLTLALIELAHVPPC